VNEQEFKERTRKLALRVIRLVESLPKTPSAQVVGRQLLRSGTSIGANHRAACRARSKADFISKMGVVEEEADETIYWTELLAEAGIIERERLSSLTKETEEILSMVVASSKTLKKGRPR